jgi:hypothetical protein
VVRRAGGDEQRGLELAVGAIGTLWRWRLELALLALPLLMWWLLSGPLGELAAAAIVAWTVLGVLASPWARGALGRGLQAARVRRQFRRAWIDAGLPPMRLARVRTVPAGEVARVWVSSGCSVEEVEARREQLAASIGLRELRVVRDPADASCATVTFVRRDPLARGSVVWPCADADGLSLWEPIPVGVDELGATVSLALPEQRAARRRARGGQVGGAVAAGRDRGPRPVVSAVAAGWQAGGALRVGAVR